MLDLIYIVAAGFFVVLFVALWFLLSSKKKSRSGNAQAKYIQGLNYLLAEEKQKALEALRAAVRLDTDNVDAYIRIGSTLRELGQPQNAIKIHRDLLVRSLLSHDQRNQVYENLAVDYYENGQYEEALSTSEKLISLMRKSDWIHDFQLAILEKMHDWERAIEIVKKHAKSPRAQKNRRLSAYKLEQGIVLAKSGKEHAGRLLFREAMKIHPGCLAAYLQLAESYIRQDRNQDAIDALLKLIQYNPEYSELAMTRLKQLLFEIGQYSEIEKVYQDLLKSNPQVIQAYLGLAEIYEKKGELLKAVEICNKARSFDPSRLDVRLLLIRLNTKLDQKNIIVEIAAELVEDLTEKGSKFLCSECGYQDFNYFYHCPSCTDWNTAKKGD
ncbi:tetratricopeptide repeat protein [candidate division KSB1 bacterium]|nr:tetratricopeptide repeat protein [candidate division KSB1 bacterium]